MTNLEAKQEAIKKAYGKYFIHADINGWIKYGMYCPSDLGIENYDDIDGFWRCKSLQGIENNNGWIKIESEADLPNDEDAIYWALKNSKAVCIELKTPINLKELFSDFLKDKITHYQLIEQPKPPIF